MSHTSRVRPHRLALRFVLALSAACSRGALQITPATLTIGLDEAVPVRAVDADGRAPERVDWTSADSNVAEIVKEDGVMHVRAVGTTCISASTIWERAETCVTVLPEPTVTAATVRWPLYRAHVRPSATIMDVVAVTPANGGPVAMFVIELDHSMGHHDPLR